MHLSNFYLIELLKARLGATETSELEPKPRREHVPRIFMFNRSLPFSTADYALYAIGV